MPGGVPPPALLPLLPEQPVRIAAPLASNKTPQTAQRRGQVFRNANRVATRAARTTASHGVRMRGRTMRGGPPGGSKRGPAAFAVVVSVNFVDVALPLGVSDGGLNAPVVLAGNPEAVNVTKPANPLLPGVTLMVKVAAAPAAIVADAEGMAIAKSMPAPLSVIVWVVGLALSVMVTVAGPRVPTDPGLKTMRTTHVPPAPGTLAPFVHVVPEAVAKSEALVPEMTTALLAASSNGAPPLLVTVMV